VRQDELAAMQLTAMATGDVDLARRCLHPEHVNHMALDEPPACALPGLPGFMATSAWLRLAFADLRFEVIEDAVDGDRAIVHAWMRGRQTGPFVVFPPGETPRAFPPTGREFAVRHCHVFRLRDGLLGEHIAVRDDLGMMTQLGHLPPSPKVAARLARWSLSGQARRAVAQAVATAERAAVI
jgi:predicted ester cyclase